MATKSPPDPSPEEIMEALEKYGSGMTKIIETIKGLSESTGILQAINTSMASLFACFSALEEVCVFAGCQTMQQLEKELGELVMRNPSFADIVEENYFQIFTDWHEFMDECDAKLYTELNKLEEKSIEFSSKLMEYQLTTLTAEDQLEKKAVSDEGCQVVVVFCGEEEWAKVWKKDVNGPFQIVIDSSRDLYYHYGMRRSVRKVFCQEVMESYINYKSSGGTFPNPYPGDDPTQSGGDIVFNKKGEVEYIHLCKTIVDRPLVSDVIRALGKLKK